MSAAHERASGDKPAEEVPMLTAHRNAEITKVSCDEERPHEMALVEALLEDDPAAWRTFNDRYSRLAYRCITRVTARFNRVITPDDVREIYAAFCMQLLANDKAKLRNFEPDRGSRLGSWLGLLASHAAYDYLRSRRREPRTEDVDHAITLSTTDRDPYEVCELRERAQVAAALLETFSDKDREFMTLYFGEGLEPEVVARRMKISVKTVYTKKHKIQARLEALLQAQRAAA
jgi:RNA polymerase sigma-70 factor (ECF subfamily)